METVLKPSAACTVEEHAKITPLPSSVGPSPGSAQSTITSGIAPPPPAVKHTYKGLFGKMPPAVAEPQGKETNSDTSVQPHVITCVTDLIALSRLLWCCRPAQKRCSKHSSSKNKAPKRSKKGGPRLQQSMLTESPDPNMRKHAKKVKARMDNRYAIH
jgi:hypothetical protein